MRKKQPSKQAYARHDRGHSGSSSDRSDVGGDMSRADAMSVGALDRGKVPSLPLRLTLSKERVMFAVN
jgi:hypothetical protein